MDVITTAVQEMSLNSNQIVHETEVDFITRSMPEAVRLTQYDDELPVIAVELKQNGEDYEIPAGAACNIRIRKFNGTTDYEPVTGCDSTRTIAYIAVTDDMTDVAGELETTLEVVVDGDIAGTSPLNIVIEPNPVSLNALNAMRSAPVQLRTQNIEPLTDPVDEITIDADRLIHETHVDFVTRRVPKLVRLVQYDATLPVLAVHLSELDVVCALPQSAACNIRLRKPDNTVVYNPALGCDSTRTIVYFEVTEQMTGVAGELHAVLEIIDSGVANTSPIRILVEENPVKDDDYESESETEAIQVLVGIAQQAAEDAEDAAESVVATAHDSEAWAVGKVEGVDVPSTADQYHNNSKYYSEQASSSSTTATNQATLARSYAKGDTNTRTGETTDNAEYYKTQAGDSATAASGSATSASTNALKAEGFAIGKQNGTDVASGSDYYHNNAKYYNEQAQAAAAMLDAPKLLGDFATYQSTLTASKAYVVGEYLTYNGYLYKVISAITSGGTIVTTGASVNVVQTDVGAELLTIFDNIAPYEPDPSNLRLGHKVGTYCIANNKLYRFTEWLHPGDAIVAGTGTSSDNAVVTTINDDLATDKQWHYNVPVTATTGTIVDIIDNRITKQHILSEIVFADYNKITALTNWSTETAGHFTITGTASAATTCNVLLVRANVIEDQSE